MAESDGTATGVLAGSGIGGSRRVGVATIAGAVVLGVWPWIDLFVAELTATPGSAWTVSYDLVWVATVGSLVVGTAAAHDRFRDRYGTVGTAGAGLSALGFVGIGLGRVIHAAHALPVETAGVGETVFWAGIATALVGGLVVATAGYLTGTPDRLISGLLMVAPSTMLLELFASTWLPAQLLGDAAGFGFSLVPLGVAWGLVGHAVRGDRPLPGEADAVPGGVDPGNVEDVGPDDGETVGADGGRSGDDEATGGPR